MKKRFRAAIVGYGNIGKYSLEALLEAPDFEVAGVVRRNPSVPQPAELSGIKVVSDISELPNVDVAILAVPSRKVEETACEVLLKGIATVDSFDIHSAIPTLRQRLSDVACKAGTVSVISSGWDPGTDSVIRALLQAMAPKGITYTNFGPGMSMGHSVAVRSIEGVRDALSMTIPLGTSIHRRMVYVEAEEGANREHIKESICKDPYFVNDETHVTFVDDVREVLDMGHGVHLTRKGVSGKTQNQLFEFDMKINNPALTAQVLVSSARAALRQQPGCYTLPELAPIDFLPGEREEWVAKLV